MGLCGQRHAPAALYPREMTPGSHRIGGWVGLRAVVDTEEISIAFAGDRTAVVQSVVRHYTDSYPSYSNNNNNNNNNNFKFNNDNNNNCGIRKGSSPFSPQLTGYSGELCFYDKPHSKCISFVQTSEFRPVLYRRPCRLQTIQQAEMVYLLHGFTCA
jgi:hypothetical protein